jgi:membrane protein implicated in regulation of membrane protease activity
MCHLVLLMPLIGLVVFWIWPLSIALPVYGVIVSFSGVLYYLLFKAMRRPVTTGTEGLIGKPAVVIDMSNHTGHVRVEGAIWRAQSDDELKAGETAKVLKVDRLTLQVGRAS